MIRIYRDGELRDEELLKRNAPTYDVAGVVAEILADVEQNGDAAVLKYTEKFDHARLETMLVSEEEIAQAMAETDARLTLSARAPYRLILRCSFPNDTALADEGLKVLRKLNRRIDELTEMKKEKEGTA